MTDYISRQEAINVAQNYHCSHDITIIPNTDYSRGFYDGLAIRENDILQGLSELKLVADVRENVYGEWLEGSFDYNTEDACVKQEWICNKCGQWVYEKSNFCPNCGAKMDGKE